MNFPGPQQSVFWYDFEGLTTDNLWPDRGPYGLHATPQAGFASPNFGLARNAHNKGYANFTGAANCYATLPLRFYTVAPTMDWTLVLVAQHTAPTASRRLFSCRNGGATRGFDMQYPVAERISTDVYDAAGAWSQIVDTANVPLTARTHTSIYSMLKSGTSTLIWHDRVGRTATWAGTANAIAYDTAVVPVIGGFPGGAALATLRMYWLILFPFVLTDSEAKAMTDWLMDQV